MQLHTGLFERQYSVAQSTAARFRELGSPRERTGGLDEAAERQRHMHGSHEERGVRVSYEVRRLALMKKKRVNSEKGKGMKFPFVWSPSFRIGKNEEFGFESVSPILRARVSSVVAVFRAGTMSAAKKARCVGLAGPIAFSRPAQ